MTLNNMNTSTTIIWGAIVFMFGIVTGFQIGFHHPNGYMEIPCGVTIDYGTDYNPDIHNIHFVSVTPNGDHYTNGEVCDIPMFHINGEPTDETVHALHFDGRNVYNEGN